MLAQWKIISVGFLITFCQMVNIIGLSWTILADGGGKRALGICLSIVALTPYIAQKILTSINNKIFKYSKAILLAGSFLGITFSTALLLFGNYLDYSGLYIFAAVFSVIFYYVYQVFELVFSLRVLDKQFTPQQAAQTSGISTQCGAFMGAILAGTCLDSGGLNRICYLLIIAFIFIMLISSKFVQTSTDHQIIEQKTEIKYHKSDVLLFAYILLIIISITIASTNLFLVDLVQSERGWPATYFGFIDSVAAVGALIGIILVGLRCWFSKIWLVYILGIAVSMLLISKTLDFALTCIGIFLWGLFINALRIKQRKILFEATRNTIHATSIAGHVVTIQMLFNSATPLLIGLSIPNISSSKGLSWCGYILLILFCLLTLYWTIKRISRHAFMLKIKTMEKEVI